MKHTEETKKAISEKMQGNKNAEVWDMDSVLDKIEEIQEYLTEKITCYTIIEALFNSKLYPQWWSEMTEKFKDEKSVSESIKITEAIIESRIVNHTMTGDAKSATFSIFLLKNKFGYVDKQENENTHKITGVDLKSAISFTDDNTSS